MTIEHDENEQVFFKEENGQRLATMTYVLRDGKMVIDHTVVDKALRGQNIGIKLVNAGVEFARDKGLKIIAECSYAKKVLEESDQYKDVLYS